MKTASIFIFMLLLMLFSSTGYREREVVVEAREREIEIQMAVFHCLYEEGVVLGLEIDSLGMLLEESRRELATLKNEQNEKKRWWRLRLR